mmetsp:Transcript_7123/g.17363  ORF Transcript_7123/g.17363 Transcript_7123/m.17363 type:complete len:1069 (-) Transcript_7123:102-3308(-)
MVSPAESNTNALPEMETSNSSSNPVTPASSTAAPAPAPVSDTDNDRDNVDMDNVHVIPTISVDGLKSFDFIGSNTNKSGSNVNDKNVDGVVDPTHTVKVSPGSNAQATGQTFSFSNSNDLSPQSQQRSGSVSSMVSGELVLSDSNETMPEETTSLFVVSGGEQQKQPPRRSPPTLPNLNTADANEIDDANKDRSDSESPASSCYSETSTAHNGEESTSPRDDPLEEDDSEVFLAKEMALAIAKNPTMDPSQLRELQQIIKQNFEQKRRHRERQKAKGKNSRRFSTKMKAAIKEMKGKSKESIKETKQSAKAAYKETKQSAREGAKKGLRAVGLMHKSNSTATTASEPSVTAISNSTNHRQLEDDAEKFRLAGTIWKRRSGLGKYSMTAPWERRRVVLQGTKLIYYKTLEESQVDASANEGLDLEDSTSEFDACNPVPNAALAQGNSATEAWINTAKTIMDKTGVSIPWESGGGIGGSSSHSNSGARGYLDLRKEKASASASYGHTGAPTPFALSIKVASTTKYKFCFESQQELMQWLAAITDVVVGGSVDAYNAEILEANDPSSHGLAEAVASDLAAAWDSASPKIGADATRVAEGGGQQLWSTEGYIVSSDDKLQNLGGSTTTFADDESSTSDVAVGGSPEDYTVDASRGDPVLALPVRFAQPLFVATNAILLGIRSDHGLWDDWFWYVLVFFNVFLVMTVDAVKLGGTVALKPELVGVTRKAGSKKQKTTTEHDGLPNVHSIDDTAPSDDQLPEDHFVPPAGSTSIRIDDPTEVPKKDGVIFAGWRQVPASGLKVRGYGYKSNKSKIPCIESLYECVELDIFESRKRVPDMAGRGVLPSVNFEEDEGPKTWNAPDIFVVAVALPTDPPKLYGGSTDNGGGYTITMYCVMRPEVRAILRRVTADGYDPKQDRGGDPNTSMVNAVKLFDEWCRRAPSDDSWMARFKVVPMGNNLAEIGLPAWIANYNGKPFLIKRPGTTGFLYRHPDKSCMEFDVSLHPFPYLAKQGICYMKDGFFKKILATLAFCIEGRTDDELPECLIGLFQLCYPDPIHAVQAEDVFAGNAPSSK